MTRLTKSRWCQRPKDYSQRLELTRTLTAPFPMHRIVKFIWTVVMFSKHGYVNNELKGIVDA